MKRVSFTAGLVVAGLLFAAQANAREGQALVQSISGEVTMLANGGKWLPLQTGEMLKTGAVVKTGAKSQADLFLGINGSMLRLAANTELKFTRLAIEQSTIEPIAQTEMELISGRVIGNVRKLPMGSSYVIKTPKGVAKVKGTVYDINADGELIVLSGKVKYTDRANGKEVLIASGGKYVGGREVKAADDEKAEAAAPANGLNFTIDVPLRQGVWENQPNHQKAGPIDPTQFIPPLFNFEAGVASSAAVGPDIPAVAAVDAVDAVLYVTGDDIPDGKVVGDVKTPAVDAVAAVAAVDAVPAIKSIVVETEGFTENQIEEHYDFMEAEFGNAANYVVGGKQLIADEVDIVVSTEPTDDGLFRIITTITPKEPKVSLGTAGDAIAIKMTLNLAGVELIVVPPPPPKVSPTEG